MKLSDPFSCVGEPRIGYRFDNYLRGQDGKPF